MRLVLGLVVTLVLAAAVPAAAADLDPQNTVFMDLTYGRVVIKLRPDLAPKHVEQVKALVQEAAQTYEQPEAVVRWHYEKPERLNDFESLAVEHNVMEWALQRANVVDKPMPFAEVMGTTPS